mmetsp:Transcript_74627/g.241294  ORF Transcript_74627/g.241294 Transcript_74627/m.241294 type:complete len:220 (+) Transcript_74627:2291-2950(+)
MCSSAVAQCDCKSRNTVNSPMARAPSTQNKTFSRGGLRRNRSTAPIATHCVTSMWCISSSLPNSNTAAATTHPRCEFTTSARARRGATSQESNAQRKTAETCKRNAKALNCHSRRLATVRARNVQSHARQVLIPRALPRNAGCLARSLCKANTWHKITGIAQFSRRLSIPTSWIRLATLRVRNNMAATENPGRTPPSRPPPPQATTSCTSATWPRPCNA